jgi:hypothetical protein
MISSTIHDYWGEEFFDLFKENHYQPVTIKTEYLPEETITAYQADSHSLKKRQVL